MNVFDYIWDTKEAAEAWGIPESTIKNNCSKGIIQAVKKADRWIIDNRQPRPDIKERPYIRKQK